MSATYDAYDTPEQAEARRLLNEQAYEMPPLSAENHPASLWDYRVVEVGRKPLDLQLKAAGDRGWELVTMNVTAVEGLPGAHAFQLVFKRPRLVPR